MIKTGCMVVIGLIVLVIALGYFVGSNHEPPKEDKAGKIAAWIQEKVNTDGFTGCRTNVIERGDPGIVQVDLHFPAGTSVYNVRYNTKRLADFFAQAARLAATIYYAGYSGSQSVCEYRYDCYTGRVTERY